eukprot:gene26782-4368_t
MHRAALYSVIKSGACEDSGRVSIFDNDECTKALKTTDYSITWGPNGNFPDVVDGCSIRSGSSAFLNNKGRCTVGASTPDWVPGTTPGTGGTPSGTGSICGAVPRLNSNNTGYELMTKFGRLEENVASVATCDQFCTANRGAQTQDVMGRPCAAWMFMTAKTDGDGGCPSCAGTCTLMYNDDGFRRDVSGLSEQGPKRSYSGVCAKPEETPQFPPIVTDPSQPSPAEQAGVSTDDSCFLDDVPIDGSLKMGKFTFQGSQGATSGGDVQRGFKDGGKSTAKSNSVTPTVALMDGASLIKGFGVGACGRLTAGDIEVVIEGKKYILADIKSSGATAVTPAFCFITRPCEGLFAVGMTGVEVKSGIFTIAVNMMAFSLNGRLGLTSPFDMWTGNLMERAPLKRYGHAVLQASTDVGFKIGRKGQVTLTLEGTLLVNGDPNEDGAWNIADIFDMLATLKDGGDAVTAALENFDIGIMATARVMPVITIGTRVIDLRKAVFATGTFLLWNDRDGLDVRLGFSAQVDPIGVLLGVLNKPAVAKFVEFVFDKIGFEGKDLMQSAAVDLIGQTGGAEDRFGIAFSMNFGGLFSLGFSYMDADENTLCLDLSGIELCGVANCNTNSDCSSVAPFCMDIGVIDVCVGCRKDADCAGRSDGKTLCHTIDIFETFSGRLPSYTCIEPRELGEICTYDSSCKSNSCGPDAAFRKCCMECGSDKDSETLISTKYNGWGVLEKREVRGRVCKTSTIDQLDRFSDAGGMEDGYFSCEAPREIGEFCTYDNTCKSGHCQDFLGIGNALEIAPRVDAMAAQVDRPAMM